MPSLNWTTFCGDNKKLYPRLFQRQWNMTSQNFDKVDTVLIPVNSGNHWTLLVIRPSRKSLCYIDSYNGASQRHLDQARDWLRVFLGDRYVAEQWRTEHVPAPRQHNAWDCGMFVITNAMCLALGLDPMCYDEAKMPTQRRRVAAMLLNGGFFGEFDLGHL
jgi:Ulp1 family protease